MYSSEELITLANMLSDCEPYLHLENNNNSPGMGDYFMQRKNSSGLNLDVGFALW